MMQAMRLLTTTMAAAGLMFAAITGLVLLARHMATTT